MSQQPTQQSTEALGRSMKSPSLDINPSSTRAPSRTRSASRSRGGSRTPSVARGSAIVSAPSNSTSLARGSSFTRLSPPLTRLAKRKRDEDLLLMGLTDLPTIVAPTGPRPIRVILEDLTLPEDDKMKRELDKLEAISKTDPQTAGGYDGNLDSQKSSEEASSQESRKRKRIAIRSRHSSSTMSTAITSLRHFSHGIRRETNEAVEEEEDE